MSENINFIPANELPEAEGDEVSVLCLENGEMKQKPGASLGGSEKVDLRIVIQGNPTNPPNDANFTIVEGGVGAVFDAIKSNRVPNIVVEHHKNDDSDHYWGDYASYRPSLYWYGEYIFLGWLASDGLSGPTLYKHHLKLNQDGSFNEASCYSVSMDVD